MCVYVSGTRLAGFPSGQSSKTSEEEEEFHRRKQRDTRTCRKWWAGHCLSLFFCLTFLACCFQRQMSIKISQTDGRPDEVWLHHTKYTLDCFPSLEVNDDVPKISTCPTWNMCRDCRILCTVLWVSCLGLLISVHFFATLMSEVDTYNVKIIIFGIKL